jgi:hypothetical protein
MDTWTHLILKAIQWVMHYYSLLLTYDILGEISYPGAHSQEVVE